MPCSNNSTARREVRRSEREVRDTIRAKRTAREQLNVLDGRLGVNVGAKRERNRLCEQK